MQKREERRMMGKRTDNFAEYAWERLENESPEAYEAFSLYRDMKPDERSVAEVGRRLGKSKTLMERWSSRHEWQRRVREYEKHVDAIALRKATTQLAEMRARHIKIGQLLQTKGLKALEKIKEEDISAKNAIRMVTDGMKYEEEMAAAEFAAHAPAERDGAEDEALAKLDDILGRIKSGF